MVSSDEKERERERVTIVGIFGIILSERRAPARIFVSLFLSPGPAPVFCVLQGGRYVRLKSLSGVVVQMLLCIFHDAETQFILPRERCNLDTNGQSR